MTRFTITLTLTAELTPAEAEQWASELVADAQAHVLADQGEALELEAVAPASG